MMKLIVMGSRLMGDDGIAVEVAERIKDTVSSLQIDILTGETDCESCFYFLNKDDLVIILDALYTGSEPGSVFVFHLRDILAQTSIPLATHDMSLLELIKLHGENPEGYLIGIEIDNIEFSDHLSPVLQKRLPHICRQVKKIIRDIAMGSYRLKDNRLGEST